MPHRRFTLMAVAVLLALPVAWAQDSAPSSNPGPTWSESPMDALADHASFHTDFTFDKSMLNGFSQTLPEEDRPIVAKLRSITVHSFRYSAPGMYNPAALAAVRAQYNGNGWQHIVSKQPNAHPSGPDGGPLYPAGPEAGEGPPPPPDMDAQPLDPTRTDVWVRMDHTNVDGAVIIVASDRNINWVVIDGMISPLDLLRLRGHFGIPQYDPGHGEPR